MSSSSPRFIDDRFAVSVWVARDGRPVVKIQDLQRSFWIGCRPEDAAALAEAIMATADAYQRARGGK